MKTSKHWIVSIMMAMTTWLVVSFLDVIPAEMAPNCRPELKQFHATLTSMQSLYGFGVAFSGCEYRSVPSTSWACLGVSVAALVCGAVRPSVCGAIENGAQATVTRTCFASAVGSNNSARGEVLWQFGIRAWLRAGFRSGHARWDAGKRCNQWPIAE